MLNRGVLMQNIGYIDGKWEGSVETLYNGPRRHEVNLFAILANGGLVHDRCVCIVNMLCYES